MLASSPQIVALSSGLDARDAVAIGPAGEAYEPDHHGAWVRKHAGGIAAEVVHAQRVGATVIAGIANGPPFQFHDGGWSAIYVGQHPIAILGRGARATVAVGRNVLALAGGGRTTKLPEAPGPVAIIGASGKGVAIVTDHGLATLATTKWKPVTPAPSRRIVALLDDRWALVDTGVVDLRDVATVIAWPSGFAPASVVAVDDAVVAVGTSRGARGPQTELVTLHAARKGAARGGANRGAKAGAPGSGGANARGATAGAGGTTAASAGAAIDREPVEFDHPAPPVAVAADKTGRVVVATHDGQLAIRDRGTWTHTQVRDELPADRPGSPPAESP